jgi:membrane protease YdiL (CAAX protease family)
MDEEAVTLIVFFALAYAITWTLFTVVATTIPARTPLGYSLVVAGAFAPATVALSLTAWQEGGRGVRRLLNRLLIADVPARYYAFALSYIVAIKLAAAALHRVLLGAWPRFGSEPWILIPLAIAVSTPFQAGEEIGWRGYALPRLAARFGLARASLLLGVLWAGWHVPQFYIAGGDTYHQSFPVWGAEVVAMSVAFAWLYARTGGSLLLVMLLHAAINNSKDIVPAGLASAPGVFSLHASAVSSLSAALLWLCALGLLSRMPRSTAGWDDGGGLDHQDHGALGRARPVHDASRHDEALLRIERH